MTLRRDRKRGQKKYNRQPRFQPLSYCMNCSQPGAHFVPPSGGGAFPGFFTCVSTEEADIELMRRRSAEIVADMNPWDESQP